MKKLLIFDLDGTLSDSSEGILYCYRKTGEAFGRTDIPEDSLRSGLGGPFAENMMRIIGIPPEKVMDGVKVYVSNYVEKGFSMCSGFPGTREALEGLRSKGYVLCVATMMVEEFSVRTLEKLGIRDLFLSVRGTNLKTAVYKDELIRRCLSDAGAAVDEAVMIGDSFDDLDAARGMGMDFIAAAYGYGLPPEVCEREGLRYVEEPMGLCGIL
ncbi:MAG: HAD hydrolase-like protein [Candidatus Methanomethylophilaceae archaeon]|nr:HAD hydrolase-like protein [Candidatus Methanomethylophilaceae archaeon]